MSMAKTTKNTEDKELADLEATFATDDSPMTQFTEEGTAEAEQGAQKDEPKKKSSNLMIYAIGGTIAAALIGYKVMGAMNAPLAVQEPEPNQQQVAQQQTPPPVIPQPVQQPETNQQQPLVTGAENVQQGNTMMQPPAIDLNASQNQLNAAPVVNPNPVVQNNQVPVKQALPNNANSVAGIDELKNAFNAQNTEFKTVLTDVGNHLDKIDGELAKQQDVNKGFDKRITALEKGKPRRVASSSNSSSRVSSKQKQGAILVDKSNQANHRANFEMQEKEVVTPTRMVDNTPQPKLMSNSNQAGSEPMRQSVASLEVHTIYSGRVWIKNSDNTLSTYAAGDTLPTGEVIKSVDNEKLEVKTNRRVIRAQ